MKNINMPGFAAEASLFMRDRYYSEKVALRSTNLDTIQPASCYNSCIGECFANGGSGWCNGFCRRVCGSPLVITFD
jgi:hypothetical protein